MLVRFMADREPAADWQPVSPQLEDVFLVSYPDESPEDE
ncbi:hypothetical protein JOD18_001987 [Gracilibacillus alcaliphilus]|nr:hypothetical protein [Gracilibacillus alcaliphilus]